MTDAEKKLSDKLTDFILAALPDSGLSIDDARQAWLDVEWRIRRAFGNMEARSTLRQKRRNVGEN